MHKTGVLISEHDERLNRVLSRIIERMGLEPYQAVDYQNFKALYIEKTPEIILLSVDPTLNGDGEVCRFLAEQHSQSTIVLLSDLEEEELKSFEELSSAAGLRIGGVLHKPLDMDRVKDVMTRLNETQQTKGSKKNSESRCLSLIYNTIKILIQISDSASVQRLKFDLNHLIPQRKIVFNALHNNFQQLTPRSIEHS